MIQMIFTTLKDAEGCLAQINKNKNLVPPAKFDYVHEWYNINHQDYIDGGRASIMKPTGGGKPSKWLTNLEAYKWTEKEEDAAWYEKIFPPEDDRELYLHD